MEDNGAAHFPSDDSISTTEGRRRRRRLLCQSNDSADGLRRSKKRPRCSHANLCIAVVFTDTERESQGTPLKSTFISLLARGRKQGGSNKCLRPESVRWTDYGRVGFLRGWKDTRALVSYEPCASGHGKITYVCRECNILKVSFLTSMEMRGAPP